MGRSRWYLGLCRSRGGGPGCSPTFHLCVGLPLVEPAAEGLAVVLGALLGTEADPVGWARPGVAQLVETPGARTELSVVLRPEEGGGIQLSIQLSRAGRGWREWAAGGDGGHMGKSDHTQPRLFLKITGAQKSEDGKYELFHLQGAVS